MNQQSTSKIKILSEQEAQKIAAGEVVERPASIVKETIENSIDAKATQISLYIKQSGKKLIRIVDDGIGMNSHDAKLCFTNHATSKIETLDDLEQIASFGFRGEALASISSVSKISLTTRQENVELGTSLKLIAGKFSEEKKVASNVGTDLQIEDLFYNTPVRKKFLKQDETEWNQILSLFNAFALSNLDVHFKLYKDDKLILNAPKVKTIKERTSQLWGHNFSQNLIVLEKNTSKNNIEFYGLISNHNFWRYGRQQIFFFVNDRYVKNSELSKALLKGYLNVLPPARFPAAFIFLNMPNDNVDINVHPRKEEVKFAKPVSIQNHLQKLVTQTLENYLTKKLQPLKKETSFKFDALNSNSIENISQEKANIFFPNNFSNKPDLTLKQNIVTAEFSTNKQDNIDSTKEITPVISQQQKLVSSEENITIKEAQPTFKIIGQFLKTYILIENNNELVIIDQHAAHERILYEKFSQKFEKKEGTFLMFPQILTLNENQINLLLKEKELFSNQGIEIDPIGKNQIAIKTSPPKIQNHDLQDLVLETINFIEENEQLDSDEFRKRLNEHMHSHMACKMAVKAGDVLDITQMQQIILDLQKTKNRFICAHGRPTTWSLDKNQVEKNFRRK